MWNLKAYGWLFSLTAYLVACAPPADHSLPQTFPFDNLLNSPECLLPCWAGIEIDQTSFNRARAILISKYGADNITDSAENNLEWKAQGIDGVDGGHISFHEDIAVDMLVFFEKDAGFTVDTLLSFLGEPTWIFVSSQPHDVCRRFDIIYPELGLYGYVDMSENQKGVQSTSKIVMLRFLQVSKTEQLQVYDGYLVKWDGFRNYCE